MTISKKDVDAWDLEYAHLKWGGISEWTWVENHLKTGDLILDAGSGEGRYLRHFCLNYNCVGIDISKKALLRSMEIIDERAEKESNSNLKFNDLNPSDSNIPNSNNISSNNTGSNISRLNTSNSPISKPDHIVSNIAELPFSNASFDGVFCLGVLQHLFWAEREKAAAEFYRVLRKGGRVFFEAFGESDMRCVGEPVFFEGKKEPRTFERQNGILYHYFEESELKDLFEKNGFETLNFQSLKKEKRYGGENYIRHHYRAVFKKN